MKKLLIIGPIGGYFGRDIEVNLVAKALQKNYEVSFFSTGPWRKNSASIKGIDNAKYTSLNRELNKKPIISIFSLLSWFYNRFRNDWRQCVRNKINAKIIKKSNWDIQILKEQIKDKDIVLCFVQLSTFYLERIILISKHYNAKLIIRSTGTIYNCPVKMDIIKKVDLFIHHSEFNKNQLQKFFEHKFEIIDQASGLENKLLSLKNIQLKKGIVFGFLGRFDRVKGIDEIVDLSIELNLKLVIAGSGEKRDEVIARTEKLNHIKNLGFLKYDDIHEFFKFVDVFIINSEHETGPLTGLEAMCAGRFIISTKVGAMPDRLKNNPNIWIERDLKTSILDFLNLEKQKIIKVANENRAIYKANYRLEHIQKKYIEAIKNVTDA